MKVAYVSSANINRVFNITKKDRERWRDFTGLNGNTAGLARWASRAAIQRNGRTNESPGKIGEQLVLGV